MQTYSDHLNEQSLSMWMDISTYCNAACPQCHRTNPKGLEKNDFLPLIQWSLADFIKAFPEKNMQKFANFNFCGTWGDPVMNKDIFEICEYIIENSDCTIGIHTNGSIRDPSWWTELGLACGSRLVTVFAVDGVDQETHSKYRQKTDLDLILKNVTAIAKTRSEVRFHTIVFKHNEDQLKDIEEMARELGATSILYTKSDRFRGKTTKRFKFAKGEEVDYLEPSTKELRKWNVKLTATG